MNIVSEITNNNLEPDLGPDDALVVKRMAHLLAIIRAMNWDSFGDPRTIKPNIRQAQLYIRKHSSELSTLFGIKMDQIPRHKIVDTINPFLIHLWRIQIIGSPSQASLELLIN